ncbi:unnamed protein product [Phytophthora fragariaefolia]|uniref:Unnamed protein product n=1 Tax=Phytophthora fragariaefolia TaxID=1490495 RepID=A0A9W6XVK6_9STRA|nr:unnamed protein product [Phytophthora fragariaefolia]
MPLARGKYERYVRAVSFVLDWLLRCSASSDALQLAALSSVAQQLARDPTSLSPALLCELPDVLRAAHCAIRLRERFAAPLLAQSKTKFSMLLNIWSHLLQRVPLENGPDGEASEWEEEEDCYCPGEKKFKVDVEKLKNERKRLWEEAFADDLALDVVFFVSDLVQLVRGVCHCYYFVKVQTSTLVEATVAVKLALDSAKELTAKLQRRHPEIRTAQDLVDVVHKHAPGLLALSRKVSRDLQNKFERGEPYKPWPFELLGSFQMILSTLDTFASALPSRSTEGIFLTNEVERYGEERTPQYMFSDPFNVSAFLMQQLPLTYCSIKERETAVGSGFDPSKLEASFLELMCAFFASRQVTIPLVFACTCWMKSILALQGNGGLGRNVAVMFKHAANLTERIERIMTRPTVLPGIRDPLSPELQQSRANVVERFNPVLAGLKVLDIHLDYLRTVKRIAPTGSIFRAFAHLYNALVSERFLKTISFFERVLEIHGKNIFSPSRSAAIHGTYDRVYLVHTVDAPTRDSSGVERSAEQTGLSLRDVSETWRLLVEDDTSSLGNTSIVGMLYTTGDACKTELFDTRVLACDMPALVYDIIDAFSMLCEELGLQRFYDDYITKHVREAGKARWDCIIDALEDAVMQPLLPLLDALQSNGSLKLDMVPVGVSARWEGKMNGERVRELGKKAGAVILAKFASPYTTSCEQKYLMFPPQPDLAIQEYGTTSFRTQTKNSDRQRVFSGLMQLLEQSSGPLYEDDLDRLKTEIKRDPQLLGLTTSRNRENRDDLCTLLHQASAGPAHDVNLVEWMIHLGALFLQPTIHCRKEPKKKDLPCPRECLPNLMAVHSAAMKGYTDIVMVMLTADNLMDLTRQLSTRRKRLLT